MERKDERRSYYRIEDIIGLTYSSIDSAEETMPEESCDLGLPLTSLFAEIDREFNQAVNTLWQESPAMAQALGLLNRKISLIAAHSLRDKDQPVDSYEDLMVSISGNGLGFSSAEELSVGARLRLSLALKPSDINITITGEVVACERLPTHSNHPYWIRVSIDGNNPAAQEQLIQHVVQKQCGQGDRES